MEDNELKPLTLNQSVKLGFFIFFFCIFILVIILIVMGGTNGFKEMIKPIIYAFLPFAFIVSLGVFIGHKKRNDKTFPKKVLTMQNPLMMTVLSSFGINFDESNPKKFYFLLQMIIG